MRFASSRGWRAAAWVMVSFAVLRLEAAPLFPEPLHLRREIHDPISGTATTVDEYCSGNRIVTVQGSRVVIADYERNEMIEVDHSAATYSITAFTDLARAIASLPQAVGTRAAETSEPRSVGLRKSLDGRQLDAYEFSRTDGDETMTIEVAVDRQVAVSAAAVEALIGAAFPNRRTFAHEATLRAAATTTSNPGRRLQTDAVPMFALPTDQSITYVTRGEALTFRSTVVDIDRKKPPPEILLIPPGATRVESKRITVPRMLEEIDEIPE